MTYELIFRAEAEQDLEDIQDYYNKYRLLLPTTFSLNFLKQWILLKTNLNRISPSASKLFSFYRCKGEPSYKWTSTVTKD
jgi:hypothetical protein